MSSSKKYLLSLLSLTAFGCVKPFDSEPFTFDKVVVVDAHLTDELKHHEILLSYTKPIGSDIVSPMYKASVYITGDDNSIINFAEKKPGIYQSVNEVAGVSGVTYQLFLTTPDNRKYQSAPEKLRASPAIDSLYAKYVEITTEESIELSKGIQFFINSRGTEEAIYFSYEWEEYFKLVPPIESKYDFGFPSPGNYNFPVRKDTISPCYEYQSSTQIQLVSSLNLADKQIAEFPVRFISDQTDELSNRYVITVRQLAISENAYSYLKKLKSSNESSGSLFDQQQGTVVGNIISEADPHETVLGYFSAAGVSSKRRFFDPSKFDPRFNMPTYRYPCESGPERVLTDSLKFYFEHNNYPQFIDWDFNTRQIASNGARQYAFVSTRICTSCSWFADVRPPSFWEE